MFDESVYRRKTSQKMQMNQKFIEKSELREMLVTPKLFFFEGFFFQKDSRHLTCFSA